MLWAVTLNIQCLYRERKVLKLPFSSFALCNDISAISSSNSHSCELLTYIMHWAAESNKVNKHFYSSCRVVVEYLFL